MRVALGAAMGAGALLSVVATQGSYAQGGAEAAVLRQGDIQVDPALIAPTNGRAEGSALVQGTVPDSAAGQVPSAPATDSQSSSQTAPASDDRPSSLAELVADQDVSVPLDDEERCLAGAIYFESKGESLAGQLAVARVVLARTRSGRFPSTICGVVYQPSQFSFVRGHSMPPINMASRDWKEAVAIAQIAKASAWDSPVEGALFFHARRVSPGWRLARVGTIGNHVFYR